MELVFFFSVYTTFIALSKKPISEPNIIGTEPLYLQLD